MSRAAPLVSALMAVYDGADYVDAAIASVLAQTHQRLELIVVDDGSRDATAARVEAWARRDARVRLLRRPHLGQALTLNAGLEAAQGDFIARIDHDDLWRPQRLEIQLEQMRRRNLDVCGAWARRFGAASGTIRFAQSHEAIRFETLFTCPILDSATLFRADMLRANPYPAEAFVSQELDLCLRLLPRYRFANLPVTLCDYRAHARQKTRRFRPMLRYRRNALYRRQFDSFFPDAPAEDRALFAAIADAYVEPLSGERLAAAGELFLRYLRPPQKEARLRMRRRWRLLRRHGVGADERIDAVYAKYAGLMR